MVVEVLLHDYILLVGSVVLVELSMVGWWQGPILLVGVSLGLDCWWRGTGGVLGRISVGLLAGLLELIGVGVSWLLGLVGIGRICGR